jgi:YD repeat-containing protein
MLILSYVQRRAKVTNVWDREGHLIGSVKKSGKNDLNTYDEKGRPLGKVRQTGTYDNRGTKISSTRDAGLTFRKKH